MLSSSVSCPFCRTRSPKLRPQLSHFISAGLSLSTLYGLAMLTPLLYLGLLLPAVCTVVRGIGFLRTSPFGISRKFNFRFTEFSKKFAEKDPELAHIGETLRSALL
jgi:hypothetical protein